VARILPLLPPAPSHARGGAPRTVSDRACMAAILCMAADGTGLPVSVLVTGANTPDAAVFRGLLDDLPKICTPGGGRRCRPGKVYADKAYDNRRCRGDLMQRRIGVRIARCGVESSARPPSLEGGTLDRLAGRLPCSGSAG
jgi:hypothetical protein